MEKERNKMAKRKITTALGVAGMLALISGLSLHSAGQTRRGLSEGQECSEATLQGEYLIIGRADSRSDSPNPARPLVFAGVRIFDGEGNLSQIETVSRGGEILHEEEPGTYTLDSNCIGTVTVLTPPPARSFDIFVARDGSEGVAVGTATGGIASHTFKRR